jgi:hypothetical protein
VETTVTLTFPEDVPLPLDGLELRFMRVCTTTDRNQQTRIIHARATNAALGERWQASFTIPELASQPRVWTLWVFYLTENELGRAQEIEGAYPIVVVPANSGIAPLLSPIEVRPPDCASP